MTTFLLTHCCLCANFWPKQHNNVAAATVFPRSAPRDFFFVPETEEAEIEDEPKHVQVKKLS